MPAKVNQVADIRRTKSGKTIELAVREVIHERVVENLHASANAKAFHLYEGLSELKQQSPYITQSGHSRYDNSI